MKRETLKGLVAMSIAIFIGTGWVFFVVHTAVKMAARICQ